MSDEGPRAGGEAARLLAAAQDWLASSAPHLAPVDEDGRTCPCPLCRVIAAVREADPEEVGQWVDAAVAGLGAALRDAVPEDPADAEEPAEAPAAGPLVDSAEDLGGDPGEGPGEEEPATAPRVRRIEVRSEEPEEGSVP